MALKQQLIAAGFPVMRCRCGRGRTWDWVTIKLDCPYASSLELAAEKKAAELLDRTDWRENRITVTGRL